MVRKGRLVRSEKHSEYYARGFNSDRKRYSKKSKGRIAVLDQGAGSSTTGQGIRNAKAMVPRPSVPEDIFLQREEGGRPGDEVDSAELES